MLHRAPLILAMVTAPGAAGRSLAALLGVVDRLAILPAVAVWRPLAASGAVMEAAPALLILAMVETSPRSSAPRAAGHQRHAAASLGAADPGHGDGPGL